MIKTQAQYELQEQRNKLANSYQSLLNEFASPDLHTVGNYTLGRLIGKGSFGKVYLATHKLTNGSKVVLKSAKKEDANLAREIHHHRQFLHPHIARLYEVIVTETLVWLVLEYCPGDELYNHLLQRGRMEAAKAQKVFTQLVGAVSYVHGKGCVHRDLKLENILLDKHGSVKLVDFGFTREYAGTTSYLQTWCGTICYSAPEMLKGEKYAGEKVDVWSLGIILFALLCGELPYDEDDDMATKALILKEEPKWQEHMPEPAKELIRKMLSKRPLLRPSLADILKDPWLAEHAPQQQEILKIQQPAAFSTQVEKDTLQRMRSAGVDIDMVIENVLSQRCDALAGWWALLIEKEQRKEKRKERKRKEREAEAKSIRRLSAASGRLLALGEIHEGVEAGVVRTPSSRGRRMSRQNGSLTQAPDLPKVSESNTPTGEQGLSPNGKSVALRKSTSSTRPTPPPKDGNALHPPVRNRNQSRGSGSMLRYSTVNPDLMQASNTTTAPQRKKPKFYGQPLSKQIAWVKHLFKEGAKRAKSPGGGNKTDEKQAVHFAANKDGSSGPQNPPELQRTSTGPVSHGRVGSGGRPELQARSTMPARPRIDTTSSVGSGTSARAKRTSLSPGTLTPHSSYRRSSGLRGRKSTSSSVSSIRTTYHQHTHSKASSTSSTSLASPSGLSSASGSRLARGSPHSSVKILPSTPTGSLPSGIRVSRRPPPANIGQTSLGGEARMAFSGVAPGSPSIAVFARRKRSIFKGPSSAPRIGGSGSRSGSIQGRRSGEVIHGITEEDEELEDEDVEIEEVDHFGPELTTPGENDVVGTFGPASTEDPENSLGIKTEGGIPLTAEALAKMTAEQEQEKKADEEKQPING